MRAPLPAPLWATCSGIARHLQMGIKPIVGCTCTDELPNFPLRTFIQYYIASWLPIAKAVFWLPRQTSSPSTMFRSDGLLSAAMLRDKRRSGVYYSHGRRTLDGARPSTISWLWRALLRAASRQLSVYRTNKRSTAGLGLICRLDALCPIIPNNAPNSHILYSRAGKPGFSGEIFMKYYDGSSAFPV